MLKFWWEAEIVGCHVLNVTQEGKLSTGNSLDITPKDEEIILSNDAAVKDMEVCIFSCMLMMSSVQETWLMSA